jgi:hypothetical protein
MSAMKQRTVDAWMFLAIAISPRDANPVSLSDVVAAADGVNHALTTEDELRSGINRLLHAGLVSEHESAFDLTDAGEAMFAKVRSGSLRTEFERLERELDRLPDPAQPTWTPSAEAIRGAIDDYLAMAEEWLRRNP